MRAVIASGSGRYADPWHPFARTSPLLADTLIDAGFDVAVDDEVDRVMQDLGGVDLLVVNAGDPWRNGDGQHPHEASTDGFATALHRGIGVLAMHCAVSSLRDYPEWAPAVGGMWVPGSSFHPPASRAEITGRELPDGSPVATFTVFDERYCRLQRLGRSTIVAHHHGPEGETEPTAWVREIGRSRVAVDVLGHDERSYESPGHRFLIRELSRWAVWRDG